MSIPIDAADEVDLYDGTDLARLRGLVLAAAATGRTPALERPVYSEVRRRLIRAGSIRRDTVPPWSEP